MGITRPSLPFEGHFTQVRNVWLRDERISRRARGLFAEIVSHRAGWHITLKSLARTGPEGRDALRATINELRQYGYLERVQARGDGSRFGEVEYVVCDPFTADGKPVTGEGAADGSSGDGFSGDGESDPKNTIDQEHHPAEHQVQDSSSSVTEVDASARADDDESYPQVAPHLVDTRRIVAHVAATCGREITDVVAYGLIASVLERAKQYPAKPTAYVMTAITRDPVGWQKFTDTGKVPR